MSSILYQSIKRTFDIFCAIIGCILLLPIALCIKIAYLLHGDTHKIIYKQPRVGKDGKVFNMYKFRSMVWNAEEELEKLLKKEHYKKQWDEYQKLDKDPRITKIGKRIRNGSIDETPQFINVLIGNMSMIGPRPLVQGELKNHRVKPDDQKKYVSVKPGITGYWATRGRNDIDYDERIKLELHYVDNASLSLDTKIFLRTFSAVFHQDGAK